jgi:4-hydroxy-tetrahydrodipicolinate synthase
MFEGTMTALVTPFKDSAVDIDALRVMVQRQIAAAIHGLVPCGTTGEAANMTPEENLLVIRHVVEQAAGMVPVIAGTGSNSTRASVEMTRRAKSLKVDGVLVVTPYYVKPPQRGLLEHYRRVAEVGVPVVAYNVPSRTGVSMTPQTVEQLAKMDNVVAIKEATADMNLDSQFVMAAASGLNILSGDDFTYLSQLCIGGRGAISVTSNIAPGPMADLYNRWRNGDLDGAREIHYKMQPLMHAMFLETNPIPVKAAAAMLGLCSWEIRTPLAPLADDLKPKLEKIMTECGVTKEA